MRLPGHHFRFTLIELVAVLAVMGIVLAVTAPSLAGFVHGRAVREESRRLVAVTRRAAEVAEHEFCRTRVWIEPATGTYGWERVETFDEDGANGESFTVPDGMDLTVSPASSETVVEITFRPDGGVEGADVEQAIRFETGSGEELAEVVFDGDRGVFLVAEDEEDGE
jgi:prepilin-type N-terminal cleavage/methylation domain-containing protein